MFLDFQAPHAAAADRQPCRADDPFTYREFHAPSAGDLDITSPWTLESLSVQTDGTGPRTPVATTDPRLSTALYLVRIRQAD